jgi:hypothetical protein
MQLYFAYGSNMGRAQMLARCPHSRKLGVALLCGWRWIIAADGYANVLPAATDVVEGVLFELTAADEAALDLHEEVAAGCYGKRHLTVLYQGTAVTALVYIGPIAVEGNAAADYGDRIQAAFTDAGLSPPYVARSLHRFIHVPHAGS